MLEVYALHSGPFLRAVNHSGAAWMAAWCLTGCRIGHGVLLDRATWYVDIARAQEAGQEIIGNPWVRMPRRGAGALICTTTP